MTNYEKQRKVWATSVTTTREIGDGYVVTVEVNPK